MSRRQRRTQDKRRRHRRLSPSRRQLATGAGVTVGATLMMGGTAQAVCILNPVDSVMDPTDGGHTTLRDAINCANAHPGSTITFASGLSGTITLASALPQITVPTTIAGPGASQLAVSGNNVYRVFDVNTGAGDDVAISGLTITAGQNGNFGGAGILNHSADLTISNAAITDNHAVTFRHGGGIEIYSGTLTVTGSTISGNTATDSGGGIYTRNTSAGATTIRSSTIAGNQAYNQGGGVFFAYGAPATVENSTIYGNHATGFGGGLYNYGPPSPGQGLVVTGSTITHNTADAKGGGIASDGGPAYVQPKLDNTIVSGNTAPTGPDLSTRNAAGSMDAAFSLIQAPDPATTINQTVPGSDIFGQDPQLGPLASNGGPTQTQKPAIGSPVVDKGAAFGLTTDQRGQQRPFQFPTIPNSSAAGADGSDIGSFELQLADLPSNDFTLGKLKGKKLPVNVHVPGTVTVADAGSPLSAEEAKKRLGLKPSSASGGPPTITVTLRLTKLAKQKLRQKGKVTVNARITFTPAGGVPKTVTQKLKVRGKRKK